MNLTGIICICIWELPYATGAALKRQKKERKKKKRKEGKEGREGRREEGRKKRKKEKERERKKKKEGRQARKKEEGWRMGRGGRWGTLTLVIKFGQNAGKQIRWLNHYGSSPASPSSDT